MSYRIAGMVIKNEYLALGTIFGTAGIAYSQMGGDKPAGSSAPPPIEKDTSITAQSKDEEDFIRQFVSEAEDGKKH